MTLIDRVLSKYSEAHPATMQIEELRSENTKLSALLMHTAANLAQNRLEMERLRRAARRQRPSYSWLVERAHLDAKGLYVLQCSGLQPSRRQAKSTLGIAERRWQWARALAMMAGVHDGAIFTETDPRTIIQRLAEAASYAETHPASLRQFKSR